MQTQGRPPLWDVREYVQKHSRPIGIALGLAILSGPLSSLGNLLWNSAEQTFSVPLAIIVSVVVVAFVVLFSLWRYSRSVAEQLQHQNAEMAQRLAESERHANATINAANRLIGASDGLFRLLPALGVSKGRPAAVTKLLQDYLHDACHVFDENVSRATILHVEDVTSNLVPWVSHQMPDTSLRRMQFYIRPDTTRVRGIAGKAFLTRTVQRVHIVKTAEGRWEADDHDYYVSDPKRIQAQSDPPYRSFVAVPILGEGHDCLGVVCFDSASPTAFDSAIEPVLLALGNRIAAIMLLQKQLSPAKRDKGIAQE